jgi:hypothetical protein
MVGDSVTCRVSFLHNQISNHRTMNMERDWIYQRGDLYDAD